MSFRRTHGQEFFAAAVLLQPQKIPARVSAFEIPSRINAYHCIRYPSDIWYCVMDCGKMTVLWILFTDVTDKKGRLCMDKRGKLWKNTVVFLLSAGILLSGCSSADTPWGRQKAERVRQEFDEMTEGLFLDEITGDTLSLHFFIADPEAYGIEDYEVTLGDYSVDDVDEIMENIQEVKEELTGVEYELLTKEQQLTYEVLDYYLDTELASEGFELYANPLKPVVGQQVELPFMFADYMFYDKRDVEDYLELLSQMDRYYGEIMDYERKKSEAGLFMSDATADEVIESCEGYLEDPEESFLTDTFSEKLDALTDVTAEEKKAYEERHLQIMKEHFIPAYELLIEGIGELKGTGRNDMGLYYLPKGREYYQYLLSSTAGVTYRNMDRLEKQILRRMNWEIQQMQETASKHPEVMEEVDDYEFALSGVDEILTDLQGQIKGRFPEIPQSQYRLKYVPESLEDAFSPAACLAPPIDRPEDNVIYINGSEEYEDYDLYTLLAHEGYPGHLYQNIYFHESGVSHLRNLLKYTSYSEGWATYVEYLAYEFDNGVAPATGKVLAYNSSINMGISALLDLYIHYYGWDMETTADYLGEIMGIDDEELVESVYRQIVGNPGNYMKYYLGYLKIADMRKEAEETLGEEFRELEFHKFLLDMGPAPFDIIEKYFEKDYLGED